MATTKIKNQGLKIIQDRCRVYLSAAQTIANNSATAVAWTAETYDNASMHDNSTNNSRITAIQAGVYLLHSQVSFTSNATGRREAYLLRNGSGGLAGWYGATNSADRTIIQLTAIVEASVNDYFTVSVAQTSGGNLDIEGGSDTYYRCHFSAIRLGDS